MFPFWKLSQVVEVSVNENAFQLGGLDNGGVTKSPARDWYLRDWMRRKGLRQADLTRDLGWEKARVSKIFNGKISYRRETVNELANWLGIQPHELLMHPDDAESLARLRATAVEIVGRKADG